MTGTRTKGQQEIEAFKRKLISERLERCLPHQVELFHRIFPHGVLEKDLESALDLCDRTIAKNEAQAKGGDGGE